MCFAKPKFPSLPKPPPPTPPPPNPLVETVESNTATSSVTKRAGLGLSQLIIPYKGVQL